MKIALLTPSIGLGGDIETPVVRRLAEEIARRADLHVFPYHDTGTIEESQFGDMCLHPPGQIDARFSRRLTRTIVAIRREHDRSPFDLLHALWLHEPGTIAVVAGTLLRVPVVASIGGAEVVAFDDIEYGALRNARGRLMTAHILQRATLVTGGSEYVLRQARRLVPHRDPARFRMAPLPVDADQFAPVRQREFDAACPHVLHVASLIPVKDQTTLLRAFRQVVDAIPGARLTIAGEDPFGQRTHLERLRDALTLTLAVTFVGSRRHAEMPALYHDADLFVLSSRHESQAMVALEAAAAGVPTVGSNVGVIPEFAPHAALAVRPADAVALADAVVDMLTDPARLARMGALARQRVLDRYDTSVVIESFLRIYADAIGLAPR